MSANGKFIIIQGHLDGSNTSNGITTIIYITDNSIIMCVVLHRNINNSVTLCNYDCFESHNDVIMMSWQVNSLPDCSIAIVGATPTDNEVYICHGHSSNNVVVC